MNFNQAFDVIIVGGGHAGIEAAYAAAKMGSHTALITLSLDKIGLMPCNPSVGGVGKGHIVYEVSALGGMMPQLCTKTYLQARMLNTSKGAAVQGLRLQIDKYAYNKLSKELLEQVPNLTLITGEVNSIECTTDNRVTGIKLIDGTQITARSIVITTGTFMNGLIHIGDMQKPAGRQGERAVTGLSTFLARSGLQLGRLKTGTPPRLLKESLDFSKMQYQEPDNLEYLFEFNPHTAVSTHPCYITRTNKKTHEIIAANLHRSAMYSGNIKGIGPRYCPSIEDKIARFPDKEGHQIFVEPEGATINEIYPSGLSTSLPEDIQKQYIQSIAGFEDAVIVRPGYAVEYDFVLPHQLQRTLEVQTIPGLFLAGQINGTTGYEEAAGQGIIAGINAHLSAHDQPPFILERHESYIGIMIDDLVTMSVDEPYRMFTSRAERRLLLRQDNVFIRLGHYAHQLGLIEDTLYEAMCHEKEMIETALVLLRTKSNYQELVRLQGNQQLLHNAIREKTEDLPLSGRALHVVAAEIHYGPYLERESREVQKTKNYQNLRMPPEFMFEGLPGLSIELQQKLQKYAPTSIAQAELIPGMTPAAISLLIFKIHEHMQKNSRFRG